MISAFKIIITVTLLGTHGYTLPPMATYPHTFTVEAECKATLQSPEFQAGIAKIGELLARMNVDSEISYECVPTQVDPNGNEVPRKPDKGTISPPLDRG
jgi:hypothetical protein